MKKITFLLLLSILSFPLLGSVTAYRGSILHFLEDPAQSRVLDESYQYIEDGLLVVANGKVKYVGEYQDIAHHYPEHWIKDYRGHLIMPGFIDTHIHYPQTEMVAAYGQQLLDWLEQYTFPTERKFADKKYARKISRTFLKQLISNGTTTALVFGTVHPQSVDALFHYAQKLNMRLIAGKVMMDRNAPDYLLDTPESSYEESKQLINKWHKKGRLLYAITPRFAPTSTPEQLRLAGKLKQEFPDTWIHTHLSENLDEIEWVKSLFPDRSSYTDVYHHYGLTSSRSVFAHAVHLEDEEYPLLSSSQSAIAFCPTSNLFLGSGLFNLKKAKDNKIRVGMGTDIGAGTSFSMFQTLNEAYKVTQLQKYPLSAFEGFYQATLGSARALSLENKIGNFTLNKEADFNVIKWAATDYQKFRMQFADELHERLFALMMLGNENNIKATFIAGKKAKLHRW
ncbi:guanine deaminase [Pleionea sp. CnH1-48]|uniref:guanine deaminase n=1 Tax=Pleionea sp. CnH1-48 TaxID=2954494 RepID=UPI00209816C6|nr:guanine deaminase [Pleionea sp. CnH1-48]MCO7227461.1 guanine deaminase [Pleionea sp. CnH1-48]